jgi:hypothetical protein
MEKNKRFGIMNYLFLLFSCIYLIVLSACSTAPSASSSGGKKSTSTTRNVNLKMNDSLKLKLNNGLKLKSMEIGRAHV